MKWNKKRLLGINIGPRTAKYEAIPSTCKEQEAKEDYPDLFNFEAISIGDDNGQAFLVPLDESDRETAEFIIRAIKAYEGE